MNLPEDPGGDDTEHEALELALAESEAREAKRLRTVIGAFSAVLLVTMVASIHLSTLELSFGTALYGSSKVWRGHGATFRLAALDPRGTRLVPIEHARISLVDGTGERLVGESTDPLPQFSLDVPVDLGTEAKIVVDVVTPAGTDRFEQPLKAVDTPAPMRATLESHRELMHARGRPERGAAVELRLYPTSGAFVDGLENRVFGWVGENGNAVKRDIFSDALGFRTESNQDGLFEFRWRPRPSPTGYQFSVGDKPALSLNLPLRLETRQLVAETKPLGLIQPGSDVVLTVRTLPFRDPLIVDVWIGDALIRGEMRPASGGKFETRFAAPPDYEGLVRVDIYRNLFVPEAAHASLVLYSSSASPDEAALEAIRAVGGISGADPVISDAAQAEGPTRAMLSAMALSRVVPAQIGATMIGTSLERRRKAVETRKSELRGTLNILFAITFILGVGLSVAWIIRNNLRVRSNVRAVVDDGMSLGESDMDPEALEQLTKFQSIYDFVLVIAALALAGYSILILMVKIGWE